MQKTWPLSWSETRQKGGKKEGEKGDGRESQESPRCLTLALVHVGNSNALFCLLSGAMTLASFEGK